MDLKQVVPCIKKCNMFHTNEGDTRVRARVYWVPCGKEKAFMDTFSGQRWYTVTVNMCAVYYVCAVLNTS